MTEPSLDCDAYLTDRKNLLGQEMQKVAENLTMDDIIALSAYAASQAP